MKNNRIFRMILILLFLLFTISSRVLSADLKNNRTTKDTRINEHPISLLLLRTNVDNAFIKLHKDQFNKIGMSFSNSQEVSYKSPWLAFGLSIVFPGLGQIYNGEYEKIPIMYSMALVGAGISATTLYISSYDNSKPEKPYVVPLVAAGFIIFMAALLWTVIDAPISANKINKRNNKQLALSNKTFWDLERIDIDFSAGFILEKPSLSLSLNYCMN